MEETNITNDTNQSIETPVNSVPKSMLFKPTIYKSIFLIFFMIPIVLLGTSFFKKSPVEKMMAYMNAKYDDQFTFVSLFGGGTGGTGTEILVTSEKFPNKRIWVSYSRVSGNIGDNYVHYKYKEQTLEFLTILLKNTLNIDIKLNYDVGSIGTWHDFTDKTTFEEFISNRKSYINFTAVVAPNFQLYDKEMLVKDLEEAFANNKLLTTGTLYFAQNEDQFLYINEIRRTEDIDSMPELTFEMSSLSVSKFDKVTWR